MCNQRTLSLILSGILCVAMLPNPAQAAFCALRDPVNTIAKLFPNATTHRSIVKIVGEQQRQAVSETLPPNVLHFSELGQHTLYVAFENNQPLGYVHVRSEESEWGLVEIAWAMDTQLRVKDFRFQRCRSRARRTLEQDDFRQQLVGMNFEQLKSLLDANGTEFDPTKISVPQGAEDLASVVLRCGLKTLLVTQLVWTEDVARYSESARALASFNSDRLRAIPIHESELTPILSRAFPGSVTTMDPDQSEVWGVYDRDEKALGAIYRNTANLAGRPSKLEWHVNLNNEVLLVENLNGWPDERTHALFQETVGESFGITRQCSDRPALMTKQAVLTAQLALHSSES